MRIFKLFKIAKASDKVAKYKVSDTFLIYFIYSYENSIDWNKINTEDDIKQFIETNLMAKIQQMIDPESQNNNYMKNISDEGMTNLFAVYAEDPRFQRLSEIYKTDKEQSKKEYLSWINEDKREKFFDWWNFFRQENPTYKNNPAFSYCMLKRMFDSSPEKTKQSIASIDPEIVLGIYNQVQNETIKDKEGKPGEKIVNLVNLEKVYNQKMGEKNAKGMVKRDATKNEGWVYLARQSVDTENYPKRLKKLNDFSIPNGWCTTLNVNGPRYLNEGDFHLFVQNNVAKVAIRLKGDKKVLEVRAKNNYPATDFWEETLRYIREHNFDSSRGEYGGARGNYIPIQELIDAENLDKSLKDDPRAAEEFKRKLSIDVNEYKKLSSENKKLFAQDAVKGYIKYIDESVKLYKNFKNSDFLMTFFDNTPPELLRLIPQEKINSIMEFWTDIIARDPSNLEIIPNQVKRRLPVGFETNAWIGFFSNMSDNKIRDKYMSCPEGIRKNMPEQIKRKVVNVWITYFTQDKESFKEFNNCPQEIKNLMSPEDLQKPIEKMIEKIAENPAYFDTDMPPEIFTHLTPEQKDNVRRYWAKRLQENPNQFKSCPDIILKTFKPEAEMIAWEKYVKRDPRRYDPKWIPNHIKEKLSEETKASVIKFYEDHAKTNPTRVMEDTPTEIFLKFSEEAYKTIAEKLAPYINDYPEEIYKLPNQIVRFIPADIELDTWKIKIRKDPKQFEIAPERVKNIIPKDFVKESWMNILSNNILKTEDVPEDILREMNQTWLVNYWSRHIRSNIKDYNKIPTFIKPLISQSTKDTVARNLANVIRTIPINREYFMEKFQGEWPRNPEILTALPDDIKNKLRQANIPLINNIIGPSPRNRPNPRASWYTNFIKKSQSDSLLLNQLRSLDTRSAKNKIKANELIINGLDIKVGDILTSTTGMSSGIDKNYEVKAINPNFSVELLATETGRIMSNVNLYDFTKNNRPAWKK